MNKRQLSALSSALLLAYTVPSYAITYLPYTSNVFTNPTRTVTDITAYQNAYLNGLSGSTPSSYPAGSLGGVAYHVETGLPSESLVDLNSPLSPSNALEIPANSLFTLTSSFNESSVFKVYGGAIKFYDGKVNLHAPVSTVSPEDTGVEGFYADGSELDISNVTINSDTSATAYQMYNSSAVVKNSTLNLTGNNQVLGFDLEKSNLTLVNSNISINSQSVTNPLVVGLFIASNSNVNVDTTTINAQNGAAILVDNSIANIRNSVINVTGTSSTAFTNTVAESPVSISTSTINLSNTTVNAPNALFKTNALIKPEAGDTYLPFVINVDNSTLEGGIYQTNGSETVPVTLNMTNGTTWKTSTNSTLTNLNNENSDVKVQNVNNTLTITGNLTGNGTFTLSSDLANQLAAKVVVKGTDSGNHQLNVVDSGNEPNAPNGKVTLVETQTGTASFRLLGKDYVDAGAYRYRLNKEGNNWVLSNRLSEKTTDRITPSTGTTPVNGITPTSSSSPITTVSNEISLSGTSNALVSLRQAQLTLVENSLDGLHQRLGELKHGEHGNVWVRNVNSRNEFDAMKTSANSHSSGFKQNVHTVQVGADMTLSDNVRLGGFVGNSRSNIDFAGEYGNGKVRSKAVGIYATYLANNGFYWDNIAKYERIKSESDYTDSRKYNAYTVSTEIGRIHTLGNGWTVTPQLQGAWTTISSKADEDRLSAFTGRAGVRVARIVTLSSWNLQPYAELNAITTKTNTNEIHVNQYSFDVDDARARIQTTLGLNTSIGNHRIGLEGAITQGENLDQPFKIQAVYRYSW